MAITTQAQIAEALPGQRLDLAKPAVSPGVAGMYFSLWQIAGNPPAAATPTSGLSGDVPTSATAGAFPFANPVAPALSYLAGGRATAFRGGSIYLYDRLWQDVLGATTTITSQAVNSVALTRPDAAGADAELWWQNYVAVGTGTPTYTVGYTNHQGTAGRTATSVLTAASGIAGRTAPFALGPGDCGVASIQTFISSVSQVSGTIGLVLRRKLAAFHLSGDGHEVVRDAVGLSLPRVFDDACIEAMVIVTSSTASMASVELNVIQG